MKNIYHLLCCGALLLCASCEEEGTEYIELKNSNPVMAITGLSPDYGYEGDSFDVIGENLEGAVDFVKVYIGQNRAKVTACTDERITVQIPKGATTGKIAVDFFGEKQSTDLTLRVLGQPGVETISKKWGFVGEPITFTGSELGTKADDIKLIFGDSKVYATVSEWSDTEFTVLIPSGAVTGKLSLMVYTKSVNTPLQDDEVFTIRQHAGLTSLEPSNAYQGEMVTIKGKNFGSMGEGLKVLVGSVEAEVQSCTEDEITFVVPVDGTLKEGEETFVTVTTIYEQVEESLSLMIKESPTVADDGGVSPAEAFAGAKVTVAANNMPETAEQLVVKFGDAEATVSDYQCTEGNATFQVQVPTAVEEGEVSLTMALGALEFYNDKFTVLSSPVMTDIAAPVVVAGETITIQGRNFGTDKGAVTAYLDHTEAEVVSINDEGTEMVITVPDGFTMKRDVQISLQYADIPRVEGQTVDVMSKNGDVTEVVLKNYSMPFAYREGSMNGVWATPSDWVLTNDFPAVIYDQRQDKGRITLLSSHWGWSGVNDGNLSNDKMYQVTTLPKGTYTFTLSISECSAVRVGGDRFGVLFGVTSGEQTLPDLNYINYNWQFDETNVMGHRLISEDRWTYNDGQTTDVTISVTMEETEQVTIGFVAYIQKVNKGGANVDVTNIKITRE